MSLPVDTRDSHAVQRFVAQSYGQMFPQGDLEFTNRIFQLVRDCFEGRHPGYLPMRMLYHDWEHTLQVVTCFALLLSRRASVGALPVLNERDVQIGWAAAFLHDIGYLKRQGDEIGTGAKYTTTHVERSCVFASDFLGGLGWEQDRIQAAQAMIRCTSLEVSLDSIPFSSESLRILGCALATADLVGQMASPQYIEKLPDLFGEFQEAFCAEAGLDEKCAKLQFSSAQDLVLKTHGFWYHFALPRLEKDLGGLYRFLEHSPSGRNDYLQAIQDNLARIAPA